MRSNISYIFFLITAILFSFSLQTYAAPAGNTFQVSTTTSVGGGRSTVASMGGNGDSIVLIFDINVKGTFMQRYDRSGNVMQANEWYLGQGNMLASIDGQGNFIIVKELYDGSNNGVFATIYDRNANIKVNQFRVNNLTTGRQVAADVSMNRNGDFAIVWNNFATDGSGGVYTKRYQLNGAALGSEVFVSNGGYQQEAMSIDLDQTGKFAIAMHRQVPRTNQIDIWGQRFDASGNLQGSPFRANSYLTGTQAGPDIAMDAVGNFVITWESWNQDGNEWGIYAQRYAVNGAKRGGEFLVNTTTTNSQQFTRAAMAGDGSFVITWEHNVSFVLPNILPVIHARQYDVNGIPLGSEFKVSTATDKKEFQPTIGADVCGNFIIGWTSADIYGSTGVAVARRYFAETPSSTPCLISGQTVSNLSGATSSWKYYKITVPAGKSILDIQQWGPSIGDADIYVRYGALPTPSQWNYRPWLWGNNERVTISTPTAGDWYIGINGYQSYNSVSLNATLY